MDNVITISGNLTAKPELRYTGDGTPVANFGVAINNSWVSNGERKTETTFWQCTAWRGLAEHLAQSLDVGQRVILQGRTSQRSWTADDGTTRSRHEIVVADIGHSLMWGTSEFTKEERQSSEARAQANADENNNEEQPPSGSEPF